MGFRIARRGDDERLVARRERRRGVGVDLRTCAHGRHSEKVLGGQIITITVSVATPPPQWLQRELS
jgi:hypothetical protein